MPAINKYDSTIPTTERDYIDNIAVKEFVHDNLMDAYFNDIDVNMRTVGMIGYTTELVSNVSEDTFNTGSVLFRETFPNRAQIPESIYSHAAIFQLSNIFSSAASCKFLLVLEEEGILKNMLNDYDKATGIFHFYISKDTKIYIEDKVFTLDYDIQLNIVKKVTETKEEYLFTANYILDNFSNSISDIKDPYVKIRRSSDGYLALEVQTHQCYRDVRHDTLVSNSVINYPIIDINFNGKLAGFDILYRDPASTNYIQLAAQVVYSQASKNPFCYYQIIDDNRLRITFNSKDNFFTPTFNADIEVILYMTEGEEGNFEVYNGTNISLVPNNEVYFYANTYLVAAKPIGSSEGGTDQKDIDSLQAITVESYRTATALTTENDLFEFFQNYKYRYGNADVLFIKKRDDVYERVFSAFFVIRKGLYIFNTNSLNLKLNLSELKNPEKNVYVLEPGYLFTANEPDGYCEFLRDQELNELYYKDYLEAVENGETPYIEDVSSEIPTYLNRPCSFAAYKQRRNLDDKITVFDLPKDKLDELDEPRACKFVVMNPFLIRFKKEPNLVSTYMTYVTNTSVVDFTDQNESCFVQFVMYTVDCNRRFTKENRYDITTKVAPSIGIDTKYPIIDSHVDEETMEIVYHLNDKYNTPNNDLRLIMVVLDKFGKNVCFTELFPTDYDEEAESFVYSGEMFTDNHITSDGRLRILENIIYRNRETGEYYKVHSDDHTLYDLYNNDDEIISTDISVNDVTEMRNNGTLYKWQNVYNMTSANKIMIPMSEVTCKVYTLYRRIYSVDDGGLILTTPDQTNNIFVNYDPTLEGYIWTNEYSTGSSPITFVQPLNSVRTYLQFEDYTKCKDVIDEETGETYVEYLHDIEDTQMYSLSFLRAMTYHNTENLDYFMSTFFNQYKFITNIIHTRLRNETNLDVKFYNSYGRSRDFVIGEEKEILDTVNLSLNFDIYFVQGTDLLYATPEVKNYIKAEVETINSNGLNNLYISNLMRKIETEFAYVDHIRFNHINYYPTPYQAVKNKVEDLADLTVEERRFYVPELLTCAIEDITINEYFVS